MHAECHCIIMFVAMYNIIILFSSTMLYKNIIYIYKSYYQWSVVSKFALSTIIIKETQ